MKKTVITALALITMLLTYNCKEEAENETMCTNMECIENNQNKKIRVEGFIRKYTPYQSGKGAGCMYWDWEIVLPDSIVIPVISKNNKINISNYKNKNVITDCTVFYGIIIGSPEGQNATGYRIDIEEIEEK